MSSKQLNNLLLSWDKNEESESQENVEEILEVLHPDTQQLWRLDVEGYKGFHFPQWISSSPLKHLMLKDCENCLQLSPIAKLPSLKTLRILNMIHVEYLYEESYDGEVVFRALEDLSLCRLPKLKRLSREDGENMFPCLSILEIDGCDRFLGEEVFLHRLHSLTLINCGKINVSAGFNCLEKLWISECRVESLQALQDMTSLKELRLRNLPKLETLPDCFGNLPLLHTLSIFFCSKLTCLPMSLSFSGLHQLTIFGCHSELEKRYEKETGEDWPNIAHIPHISVGSNLYDHISDWGILSILFLPSYIYIFTKFLDFMHWKLLNKYLDFSCISFPLYVLENSHILSFFCRLVSPNIKEQFICCNLQVLIKTQ